MEEIWLPGKDGQLTRFLTKPANVQSVEVRQITEEQDHELAGAHGVNLGGLGLELQVGSLLDRHRQGSKIFRLDWEGSNVPRGVNIAGKQIGGTQSGIVTATDGTMIGTYDRLVESGGSTGRHQQMLIYQVDG